MSKKSGLRSSAAGHVRDIRRRTRRKFSSEEKIRIVLEGLRGEYSIVELCRRQGIAQSQYYSRSKEFLEAGKRRLSGDSDHARSQGSANLGFVVSILPFRFERR